MWDNPTDIFLEIVQVFEECAGVQVLCWCLLVSEQLSKGNSCIQRDFSPFIACSNRFWQLGDQFYDIHLASRAERERHSYRSVIFTGSETMPILLPLLNQSMHTSIYKIQIFYGNFIGEKVGVPTFIGGYQISFHSDSK